MTFARPELLALAPLAALALALALGAQWGRLQRLGSAYGPAAARRLVPVRLDRFPSARLACLVVAGLAVGVAAAGPRRSEPEGADTQLDIAIAVDLSLSMNAPDADPTRIGRAKEVIATLSEELPSARIALVVFAGWPYTLVPPTDDPAVVRYFAGSLEADLLQTRDQGTSLSATIRHAREALAARPRPGARGAIVVLSDGDAHDEGSAVTRAAAEAASDGIEVWTAGVGTERGTELFVGTEPVVDGRGIPVTAFLDDELLRDVATAGGGDYQNVTDEGGLRALVGGLQELGGGSNGGPDEPADARHWLTLLAIPLLLWEGALDAGKRWPRRRSAEVDR